MVIPTYTINKDLEELAIRACLSYRDSVDELIVTEDGGLFSVNLMQLSDIYIYNKENKSFTANVNRGWRQSTGDYTMIVNSDTSLHFGDIKDLCVPGKVTSPTIANQYIDYLAGPFFCVPKEVKEDRGILIEDMVVYSSDSEYDNRIRDIFQKVPSVIIYHEQAQTVKAAGVEGGEQQEKDRLAYKKLIDLGKAK